MCLRVFDSFPSKITEENLFPKDLHVLAFVMLYRFGNWLWSRPSPFQHLLIRERILNFYCKLNLVVESTSFPHKIHLSLCEFWRKERRMASYDLSFWLGMAWIDLNHSKLSRNRRFHLFHSGLSQFLPIPEPRGQTDPILHQFRSQYA